MSVMLGMDQTIIIFLTNRNKTNGQIDVLLNLSSQWIVNKTSDRTYFDCLSK